MPINPNTGLWEDELQEPQIDPSYNTDSKISAALSALGAGFMGRDPGAAASNVLSQRQSALDKWKQDQVNKIKMKRESTINQREDEKYAQEQEKRKRLEDIASEESNAYRALATKMLPGKDFSKMSGAQISALLPSVEKLYEIDQKALDRKEARDERRFQQGIKMDEKMQGLKTPFGLANTEDDAKKLKEAFEAKTNFDKKIQEMIDLRKKYGTEYFDREAVARGKQLSKDLLLEYKNMQKLGVLSQADEAIINAIIPDDPLGQDWAPGQDPILSNLEKFKKDAQGDFDTKVATRTRSGVETAAQPKKKEIIKTQTNKKTGQKRVVYSDGSTEIVNEIAGGPGGR